MVPNSKVEVSSNRLLTVDEVEKVQRQRLARVIGHVFQLTFAALFDTMIHEEKVRHCNGCAINHPSQRQHSCLMMDEEDAWMYYRDDVLEKIDLNVVQETAQSVCSALGLKLGKSWNTYVTELPKFPWTSIYLTSLELSQGQDLKTRILHALYDGPNGVKSKDWDFGLAADPLEVECPETIVRKEEVPMDLDVVINDIQSKLCI